LHDARLNFREECRSSDDEGECGEEGSGNRRVVTDLSAHLARKSTELKGHQRKLFGRSSPESLDAHKLIGSGYQHVVAANKA